MVNHFTACLHCKNISASYHLYFISLSDSERAKTPQARQKVVRAIHTSKRVSFKETLCYDEDLRAP